MQEWLSQLAAHGLDGGAQGIQILAHLLKGGQAHEAGEGQGEFGQHPAALDSYESSAQRKQAIDGHRHILIPGAHYTDVVAVMADRGGERPLAEAKALDET